MNLYNSYPFIYLALIWYCLKIIFGHESYIKWNKLVRSIYNALHGGGQIWLPKQVKTSFHTSIPKTKTSITEHHTSPNVVPFSTPLIQTDDKISLP